MNEGEFEIHTMPAVYVLEAQMPKDMVNSVNDYMDEYKHDKNKQSLANTLVGQIDKGEKYPDSSRWRLLLKDKR